MGGSIPEQQKITDFAGAWKGIFWGTSDAGDVEVQLFSTGGKNVAGKIRLLSNARTYEAELMGAVDGDSITATLNNFSSTNATGLPQTGTLNVRVTAAAMEGEWATNLQHSGRVVLHRSTLAFSPPPSTVQPAFLYRGTTRNAPVPSCLLKPLDLRKLYELLEKKAAEAAELQVASLMLQPSQTPEQFDKLKTAVRESLSSLIVRLQMSNGDWMGGTKPDPLNDEQLPDGITRAEFDSAALYQANVKSAPNNHFLVTLDFRRPDVLDMNSQPIQNSSVINITANDSNWAKALSTELETFFKQTPTRRGWLHAPRSYDVLLVLFGFPLSFYTVYHLDRIMRHRIALPEALAVALYVWLVLIVFFFFRLLFNYARWTFPKMEVDAPRQHRRAVAHRIAVSSVALMILGALVKAFVKLFFGIG